jgi:FkbM family methyltransferase
MIDRLRRAVRYTLNLDFVEGLSLYLQVEILRRKQVWLSFWKYPFFMWRNTSDSDVSREIFLHKIYQFDGSSLKTIIDGGSNIGLSVIDFKARYPLSKVYATEPDDSNSSVLAQNVVGRGDSVVAIHSAVWSSNCFLKFKDDEASHWMKEVEECNTQIGAFKAVSLNWLIDDYGLERIDPVKLDVEGAERAIFHANYEWIGRTKFILLELHDWLKPGCSNAFFRAISQLQRTHFHTQWDGFTGKP